MKTIKIMTPENIELEFCLAGLFSRAAAAMIDTLIQMCFMMLELVVIIIIDINSKEFFDKYIGWIVGTSLIVGVLILYGYYVVLELNMNGKTLGKKIMNIRTIRMNGQPLSLRHCLIRNLFRVFIDNMGIGVVMIFLSQEQRRVGDLAASTVVIIDEKKKMPCTLDTLEGMDDELRCYLTKEEYELLKEYAMRRSTMKNYEGLRNKLKEYFTEKSMQLGNYEKFKRFIDAL